MAKFGKSYQKSTLVYDSVKRDAPRYGVEDRRKADEQIEAGLALLEPVEVNENGHDSCDGEEDWQRYLEEANEDQEPEPGTKSPRMVDLSYSRDVVVDRKQLEKLLAYMLNKAPWRHWLDVMVWDMDHKGLASFWPMAEYPEMKEPWFVTRELYFVGNDMRPIKTEGCAVVDVETRYTPDVGAAYAIGIIPKRDKYRLRVECRIRTPYDAELLQGLAKQRGTSLFIWDHDVEYFVVPGQGLRPIDDYVDVAMVHDAIEG